MLMTVLIVMLVLSLVGGGVGHSRFGYAGSSPASNELGVTLPVPTIVANSVFYNGSAYDGQNGSSNLRESGTHAHVPGIPRFPAKRVSEACHQHPGWRPSNYWRGQLFKLPKIGVRRRGYALGFPQSLCSDRFLLTRNLRHAGIDNARTFAARHDPTGKGSI